MFLVLFTGVGKQAFLILPPFKPWNSTEIKGFCCGIWCKHLNKLLTDKIAHSLMFFFIDLKMLQFFKVVVPEGTIFTDAVTKELTIVCTKCYHCSYSSGVLCWQQEYQLICCWCTSRKLPWRLAYAKKIEMHYASCSTSTGRRNIWDLPE